ncbi:MAG TPA: hypothetical protein VMF64_06900 [Steroidobacteraceae bacterium]|nr:hypothetical protein [Steroidobacteraceae bacterium]
MRRQQLIWIIALGGMVLSTSVYSQTLSYDFSVNGGLTGPLAGVTSTGTFTINSSIIPPSGGELVQKGLLTNLAFNWNGITYSASTANTGFVDFSSSGALDNAVFGDACGAGCGVGGPNNWFVVLFPNREGIFAYDVDNVVYDGPVGELQQVSGPIGAPELNPAGALAALTLLAGLAAIVTGRRRSAP